MIKRLVLSLAILLIASQASATLILFDEGASFGQPFMHADWVGNFTFESVSLPIGNCVDPEECIYDYPVDTGFNPGITRAIGGYLHTTPHNNQGSFGQGRLNWSPDFRSWSTTNTYDSPTVRGGAYCVVGTDSGCQVPESSPVWLVLTGFALIAVSRCRSLSLRPNKE